MIFIVFSANVFKPFLRNKIYVDPMPLTNNVKYISCTRTGVEMLLSGKKLHNPPPQKKKKTKQLICRQIGELQFRPEKTIV
jgi:hypothetical protein